MQESSERIRDRNGHLEREKRENLTHLADGVKQVLDFSTAKKQQEATQRFHWLTNCWKEIGEKKGKCLLD